MPSRTRPQTTACFGLNRAAASPPGIPPRSAPAPNEAISRPAPVFERSNSSAKSGTSGVSAVYSMASTKMIELTRASSRRMRPGYAALRPRARATRPRRGRFRIPRPESAQRIRSRTKERTEPVTSSSGNPTDLRRSGCHSESHRPRTLRTRCSRDSMRRRGCGQAPFERKFAEIATGDEFEASDPRGAPIVRRSFHQSQGQGGAASGSGFSLASVSRLASFDGG